MKSRIEFTKFNKAFVPEVMDFLGLALLRKTPVFMKCTSHSHHDFTMFFLNDQIGINFFHYMVQILTCKLNVIDAFFKLSSPISRFKLIVVSAIKRLCNPLHDLFIGITNFDVGVIVPGSIAGNRFGIKNANEKTSFTINESGKISKIDFRKHNPPVYDQSIIN